ncbi:MAG: A/G-specific adenine glycosylase [Novosphingobium sp. 28-62-57]|uniref:A/G-specific adenine glycosylase n=1 Tax=unclassified Novosphingobium TaxID=2644732 RepID=UPI000BD83EF4|nr:MULTISPECIES: A/G-specific adenine glycosylase [unclassified Novosphingobium]OYW51063.1 MAG: A/G-specific adenine glycosylase [Novosphingobium sp. 12-62-10]OYZ11116.1 MAG: A/G-specific adenine glycosylase [Novosphingobium sp. 28-62-57]HQS69490.1 A/G-specific adenine glycosylase [Novosphingobium sp.]
MQAREEATAKFDPEAIAPRLLGWYDVHARRLPWRKLPGEARQDPYKVWLSEVMLQQTTVAAVGPYFAKFTERWPTVGDLAAADDADVMAAWAGLGYYARARNLLACARAVAAMGGVFPDTEEGLRALPGLGEYTAAAVAAIAFGRRAVVVDANVERVVARLFAIDEPLPGGRAAVRFAAGQVTPDARAGDFAQAMMDLGATICTARSPRCMLCPLSGQCRGLAEGAPERLPVKAAKKAKPVRQGRAYWIERGGEVLLITRPGHGMLGGMRALPDDGWSAKGDGAAALDGAWHSGGVVRHSFTHFDLELQLMLCLSPEAVSHGSGEWWPVDDIEAAGLPTVFAKAARMAIAERNG